MSRNHESDPFGPAQADLFGAEPAPKLSHRADPERVRARLATILTQARGADTLPWSRTELRLYQTIVPQMTRWLPDEEARQWCLDFELQLRRLKAA